MLDNYRCGRYVVRFPGLSNRGPTRHAASFRRSVVVVLPATR